MSMLNVGALNQKIIAQSVKTTAVQPSAPENSTKKEKSLSDKKWQIASAAVAAIAIAGILIANRNKIGKIFKGSKAKNNQTNPVPEHAPVPKKENKINPSQQSAEGTDSSGKPFESNDNVNPNEDLSNNPNVDDIDDDIMGDDYKYVPPVPKLIDKVVPYDENYERLRLEAEIPVREKITEIFKRYREDQESAPEFNKYRIANVLFPEHVAPPIKPDLRELEEADLDAVLSFLEKYQYNAKMRAGIDVSDVDEVKRLMRLIDEAEPLEEDTYVYRGIRTRELWGEHKELDFAKDMEVGDTLKDRAFVSTSRSYDVDLAATDPKNLEERLQNCGFIMRIKLPKGTKGLDCRRCSMVNSDRGINAVYILPPGAEFKIRAFDYPRRIIACDYILPNK